METPFLAYFSFFLRSVLVDVENKKLHKVDVHVEGG